MFTTIKRANTKTVFAFALVLITVFGLTSASWSAWHERTDLFVGAREHRGKCTIGANRPDCMVVSNQYLRWLQNPSPHVHPYLPAILYLCQPLATLNRGPRTLCSIASGEHRATLAATVPGPSGVSDGAPSMRKRIVLYRHRHGACGPFLALRGSPSPGRRHSERHGTNGDVPR